MLRRSQLLGVHCGTLLYQIQFCFVSLVAKLQPHVWHIGLFNLIALWTRAPERICYPVLLALWRKGADKDAVAGYLAHVCY